MGECAEWNSARGSLARAETDMGVPVEYLYPRHTSDDAWVNKTHVLKPYTEGWISRSCTVRIGSKHLTAQIEVLTRTRDLDLGRNVGNRVYIADGGQRGDVIAGLRGVGFGILAPTHCLAAEPVNHPLRTARDRYRQCGINPSGDELGVIDMQGVSNCIGLDVWVRSVTGARTLSLNSHLRPLCLNGQRTRGGISIGVGEMEIGPVEPQKVGDAHSWVMLRGGEGPKEIIPSKSTRYSDLSPWRRGRKY